MRAFCVHEFGKFPAVALAISNEALLHILLLYTLLIQVPVLHVKESAAPGITAKWIDCLYAGHFIFLKIRL